MDWYVINLTLGLFTRKTFLVCYNSRTPRTILNEIKWKEGCDIRKAEIWYVHRGALNDTRIIGGREILELGRSFFRTESASIPYHRIFKIEYDGEVVFNRRKRVENE